MQGILGMSIYRFCYCKLYNQLLYIILCICSFSLPKTVNVTITVNVQLYLLQLFTVIIHKCSVNQLTVFYSSFSFFFTVFYC